VRICYFDIYNMGRFFFLHFLLLVQDWIWTRGFLGVRAGKGFVLFVFDFASGRRKWRRYEYSCHVCIRLQPFSLHYMRSYSLQGFGVTRSTSLKGLSAA